jgi:structural maintenance of chromosome 3 (chondroitin sulfate proteoglycan 6)
MHLKAISIDSFASYEKLEISEGFGPATNLILGRNGTGKSNLLQAIIFCLSDAWRFKTKQEKRNYLHVSNHSWT